MATDVAQRDLDQAGFRIANLGDPTKAADATKTDNTSVPKPNAGTGSPGKSLLAAPADHVHPGTALGTVGSPHFKQPRAKPMTASTRLRSDACRRASAWSPVPHPRGLLCPLRNR